MSTKERIDRDGDLEMQDAGPSEPSMVTSGHKREDSGYVEATKAAPIGRFTTDEASWKKYVSDVGQMFYLGPEVWGKELDAEGCGNINVGSSVGDLVNAIHPLFARERFLLEGFVTNTNSNLWRDLEPALRLASRMLVSPPVMAFLRKVKFGSETTDANSGRVYIMENTSKPIDEANVEVMQDLLTLSQKLRLVFTAIGPDPDEAPGQCHGIHYISQKEFGTRVFLRPGQADKLPVDTGKVHYLAINEAYREYLTNSTERTPSKDFRTRFLLASTLIHETVGHAFYARNRTDGCEDYEEPFYTLDQRDNPELGLALEHSLWGTCMNAIISPRSGGHVECWPILAAFNGTEVVTSNSHVVLPVKMAWIRDIFSEMVWRALDNAPIAFQMQAFNVPSPSWAIVRNSLDGNVWRWVPRFHVATPKYRNKEEYVEFFEEKNEKALQKQLR